MINMMLTAFQNIRVHQIESIRITSIQNIRITKIYTITRKLQFPIEKRGGGGNEGAVPIRYKHQTLTKTKERNDNATIHRHSNYNQGKRWGRRRYSIPCTLGRIATTRYIGRSTCCLPTKVLRRHQEVAPTRPILLHMSRLRLARSFRQEDTEFIAYPR